MKKILFMALGAGLLMTSCQSDEPFAPGEGGEKQVSFTLSVPETMGTRADGMASDKGGASNNPSATIHYTLALYSNGQLENQVMTTSVAGTTATFNPTVILGRNYTVVAYADFNGVKTNLNEVAISNGFNAETEDAYFANKSGVIFKEGDLQEDVVLKRPSGKLRLVATDFVDGKTNIKNVTVKYLNGGHMTAFDALKGEYSGTVTNPTFTADYVEYADETGEKTVFVDYIPVNGNGVFPFEITVNYTDAIGGSFTRTFAQDIPVKRNGLTTLKGDFFTANATISVTVEDDFDGEATYGTVETIYKVTANKSLEDVIKQIKEEKPEYVAIDLDVDATYTTTGSDNTDILYLATADTKQVTINGNGKSITFTGAGVDDVGLKDGLLVLNDVTVIDETKSYNEGAWEFTYLELGSIKATNVNFQGGVMFQGSTTILKDCNFITNETSVYAAWVYSGDARFEGCHFTGTRGLKMHNAYGTQIQSVNIDRCKFEDLTEKPGVAIDIASDVDVTIKNSEFINCQPGDQKLFIYETDNLVPTLENNRVSVKYEVNSKDDLKEKLTGAGLAGAGNTVISLNTNIDMTGVDWTPVKVDGYHGADVVELRGNGHTITNLSAPLFAGGFAGGSGIIISDLTIDNSAIVSTNTLGSGAFIETIDSMDIIELDNCHLKNSTLTGGNDSRTGGLIGWTSGYNNVNDGAVKTYVTIKNCSVEKCTITCNGSVGGIYGHAGANAWTYSTVKDCTVKDCNLISTDDGGWRVGVVVGTANVGELTISNITQSGNVLTQTGKTAPEGQSNLYGRFVPGDTGKLIIDGVEIK